MHKPFFRSLAAAALAGFLLAGCEGSSSDNVVVSPPRPAGPRTALKASVLGKQSEAELTESLRKVVFVDDTKVPDPAADDVLIVEGKGGVPSDKLIDDFFRAGKTVVFLHLTQAEKAKHVLARVGGSTSGDARAFAIRRIQDRYGNPEFFLMEWKEGQGSYAVFEDALVRSLAAKSFAGGLGDSQATDDTPRGTIHTTLNLSQAATNPEFKTIEGNAPLSTPQYTSLVPNFTATIFLENQNNATGDDQLVLLESDLTSSPVNPSLGTLTIASNHPTPHRNIGWFQVGLQETVTPQNQGNFQKQGDSPPNTNSGGQITTGVSFGINISNPESGGGLSFTYQHSVTQDLTDWQTLNQSGGVAGSWNYLSYDPYAGDQTNLWTTETRPGGGVEGVLRHLRTPSSLSLGELTATTQVVYRTSGVLNTVEPFLVTGSQTFANVYGDDGGLSLNSKSIPFAFDLLVDMAAVLPIPIQSLTFQPAMSGPTYPQTVTGTVTLASPAKYDLSIPLVAQSDHDNVVVDDSVSIAKGATTGTFQMIVNANGLASGQSTVVNLQAVYGNGFLATYTIQN